MFLSDKDGKESFGITSSICFCIFSWTSGYKMRYKQEKRIDVEVVSDPAVNRSSIEAKRSKSVN